MIATVTINEPKPPCPVPREGRFFQEVDWVGFCLTTFLALAVYLLTLAPEVTLDNSGVYSTAALYASPSVPPGHPVWAVYGWCFTRAIPFSNIAWRLGLASAVAGAFTCGLVALMVSRVGLLVGESLPSFRTFLQREQTACRLVCGAVAGLGFGFDRGFWRQTIAADPWSLSVFLFALTICLLSRWFFSPQSRRYLYLAAFVHGLNLSESQVFVSATFAFPFLMVLPDRRLGQQMFFAEAVCLWGIILLNDSLSAVGINPGPAFRNLLIGAAVAASLAWAGLSFWTRRLFGEWKASLLCGLCCMAGAAFYLLLPLSSMTNPPMNFGYSRTVEGFFHLASRGQFEQITPTNSLSQLLMQWGIYGRMAAVDLGPFCLIAAVVPFVLLRKLSSPARSWVVGMLVVWFLISLLLLIGLNLDQYSARYVGSFFAPTHLILALFAGCGLILLAAVFGRKDPVRRMP